MINISDAGKYYWVVTATGKVVGIKVSHSPSSSETEDCCFFEILRIRALYGRIHTFYARLQILSHHLLHFLNFNCNAQIPAMVLKTIILEDEPAILKELEWLVNANKNLQFAGSAADIKEAIQMINHRQPDLLLMDIQLKGGTAFEVLNALAVPLPKIIFITAYNHFAIKAIKYGAVDYLLKPVDDTDFEDAISKVAGRDPDLFRQQLSVINQQMSAKRSNASSQICIASVDYLKFVALDDILFCASESSYTQFHLADRTKLVASKTLKHYEDILPVDIFLRTHQSYIVNKNHIDKFMKSGLLIMKDGSEVPVATRRRDVIIQHILQ